MSFLRIFLARHGQTDWNLERRLQGWTDVPLNETGKQQALELSERLEDIRLDCIYCSALQRSRQTAMLIAKNTPVISLVELNEQSLGKFEGKYVDGREPELLPELERRLENSEDSLDGGESISQHFSRVEKAVQTIRKNHAAGGQILIVGHGGTNHLILELLTNRSGRRRPFRKPQDHTELHQIDLI